jgi:hypothetical protein
VAGRRNRRRRRVNRWCRHCRGENEFATRAPSGQSRAVCGNAQNIGALSVRSRVRTRQISPPDDRFVSTDPKPVIAVQCRA